MATSFMSNLRKPKSLGRWAPTGAIRAGESDPYAWAKDMIERESRDDGMDFPTARRGNIGRLGSQVSNWNPGLPQSGRGFGQMDVIYNQAPEMAQKQLNMRKDENALAQKNLEAANALKAAKANDDYIDNRRNTELKAKQVETADWAARNLKPGEMGEKDRLALQYQNAKALNDADNSTRMTVAEKEIEARRINEAERAINEWAIATNRDTLNNRTSRENNAATTAATQAAADARAAATIEAARIRSGQIQNAVPSAALGGTLAAPGLRNDAPIDPNANAAPFTGNQNNQAGGMKPIIQVSPSTGRKRISVDGGKTWQPYNQ